MRKIRLYGVFAISLLMLSSCLGDPASTLSLSLQPGVVEVDSVKVIDVKGGQVISSEAFQKQSVSSGDCCLVDFTYDSSVPVSEYGYLPADITRYQEVADWQLFTTLTDTTKVLDNELLLTASYARYAYIRGQFFFFSDLGGYQNGQEDSLSLSYNPAQAVTVDSKDGRFYNLYLRIIKKKEGTGDAKVLFSANAFDIEDFVKKIAIEENAAGMEEVRFKVNYASGFNKDTTKCQWASSSIYSIPVSQSGK